jgi:O-acetyl-ADP-ribose deacetylase
VDVKDFRLRLSLDGGKLVELHGPADITREATDAIVNAANSQLIGGGGVDGAIHRAAGPSLSEECRQIITRIRQLPPGKAVITGGGLLPAKFVIHTVGPVYHGGQQGEAGVLASCYRECIQAADERAIASLAFPSISTGAYGYPMTEAAHVAVQASVQALNSARHVRLVRFVLFDMAACRAYDAGVKKLSRRGACRMERDS